MPLVRVTIGRMVLGWDIGGVNTKVARVAGGCVRAVREQAFELQRAPDALVGLMRQLAIEVGMAEEATHAVTMTAELSQMFRTKRDGVAFVVDAVLQAFPNAQIDVFTVDGTFVSPEDARRTPLTVAAANWMATALVVAQDHPDALLIDVGSTTTDLVPILDGRIVAAGRTDLERLASSELVYTGVLRTPVEAITSSVIVRGSDVGVAAEGFALIGDVHVWRGDLRIEDYTVTAPDGRPASREYAGERLARLVCADREMLTEADISAMADSVAVRQVEQIANAIRQLMARVPALRNAMVAGRGAFLGAAAARAAGLPVSWLSSALGDDASRSAPAAAVALLLEASRLDGRSATANRRGSSHTARAPGAAPSVDTVIKIGGGMLHEPGDLDSVLAVLDAAAGCRVLLVPGGGPFADAVRDIDRRLGLSDDAAHWMAILAMDQYAELLATRLGRGVLVRDLAEARAAVADARVPVLAPSRWLREADPLPHSWDVTSDSIAAWVAGAAGASQLVLVKPRGAQGNLVDSQFASAVPPQLCTAVLTVDRLERIRTLIHEPSAAT